MGDGLLGEMSGYPTQTRAATKSAVRPIRTEYTAEP
jgi:hypothetical protein